MLNVIEQQKKRSIEKHKTEVIEALNSIKNISNLEIYLNKQEEFVFGPINRRGFFCTGNVNIDNREIEFKKEIELSGMFFHFHGNLAQEIKKHYESLGIPVEIKKEVYSDIDEAYEKISPLTRQIIDEFPFIPHWVQICKGVGKSTPLDFASWPPYSGISCYVWGTTEDGRGEFFAIPVRTKKEDQVMKELTDYCSGKNIEVRL